MPHDVRIAETAVLRDLVHVGDHVSIDHGVYSTVRLSVGCCVHVSPYVCFIGGRNSEVVLEDHAFCAAGSKLVAGSEDYTCSLIGPMLPEDVRVVRYGRVVFERFAGCGANAVVLPDVVLAEGSVVGAGVMETIAAKTINDYLAWRATARA